MLSDKISTLYALLQCNNTDIARYAGCSSGNISKLKTGRRIPKPGGRSIQAFAGGIYGYADYENMLSVLAELCGAADTRRETLIPALIAWLYETKEIDVTPRKVTPRSQRVRTARRQSFGDKLDRAMTLLDISNGKLAARLNIDVSLVSRYRCGLYSPQGNETLSEKLSGVLMDQARKAGQESELAALCGQSAEALNTDTLTDWLYESTPEEDNAAAAQRLLRSLEDFTPGDSFPTFAPEVPEVPAAPCYIGTEGLRSAVVRFLSDAAREGGELLLYSDEPMDWMSGDRAFFALWASLMVKCVRSGVHIRIIHNLDREGAEMIDAITGWFPLYISGMIEPFVFRKVRNTRFCHTLFLRPGAACVHGFFPGGSGESRWYEYITDAERLKLLEDEFQTMLSAASPFMKAYTASMSEAFHNTCMLTSSERDFLLNEFPVFTMPEGLLERMLSRSGLPEEQQETALARCRDLRRQFADSLRENRINIILCIPPDVSAHGRYVNFGLCLMELSIEYTQDEYADHIAAIMELVKTEKNFHLTLLPSSPFHDIQIIVRKDAVAVLRCREPYAAFAFFDPMLRQSVSAYFSMLNEQYAGDRNDTLKSLEERIKLII